MAVDAGPDDRVAVFRCAQCGHGVTRPPVADVAALYDGRESQDYQNIDGGLATAIKRYAFARQATQVLKASQFRGGTAVDFACGSGVLTNAIAAALPPGSSMVALDFFARPPRPMPDVRYLSFAEASAIEGSADLVTCFHALEHDDVPDVMMARLCALLAPGGTLVVEVPNGECVWAEPFGRAWDNWYLPYHRQHYTRGSLRAVVERHGLDVVLEQDVHVPSFGRSFSRALGRKNTLPFLLAGAVAYPIQLAGEIASRRPSALRIIARAVLAATAGPAGPTETPAGGETDSCRPM